MKVNSIDNKLSVSKKPSFKGYDIKKDDYGEKIHHFSYPFDSNRYDCYLKIVSVFSDENGDYKIGFTKHNFANDVDELKLNPGDNEIDLSYAYRLGEKQPFGYQYILKPKGYPDAIPMYKVDSGDILDERDGANNAHQIFNLVVPNGATSSPAGAAILIGTDNYDVRWVYDKDHNIVPNPDAEKGLNASKDFANAIGGTAAGFEHAIDSGELDIYSKLFLLPFATGDRISRHFYWLESGYQLSDAMDDMQTYARIQQKLFAKGKNLVSDAAITSEGLSGVHLQSIFHYGYENNVFADWFKADALKDMTAKIGVFGKKTSFIRHKLVNAPFTVHQDEHGKVYTKPCKYDKTKPTYVQVYNIKSASDDQVGDHEHLIKQYGKPASGEDALGAGTHNDTVMAYNYPIDPNVYKKNIKNFNDYNKTLPTGEFVPLNSYEATRILTKFEHFEFDNKFAGGFYTWDANLDMVKYHYTLSNADIQEMMNLHPSERRAAIAKIQRKNCEVQDYAISSVKYWTRKTNQILNLYTAQALKNIDEMDSAKAFQMIKKRISDKVLPEKLTYDLNKNIIENVQNGTYELHGMDSVESLHNNVLNGLMEFPLESAELGKDILSLFSTPYITKRATHPDEIGKSRMEMLAANNPHLTSDNVVLYNMTTHMYKDTMYKFAKEILDDVNNRLPEDLKFNLPMDNTSPYGKYVIPLLTQEIAKFAVMKGLVPDLKYSIDSKNGGIIYDYDASRQSSLKSLGIYSVSQKQDAEALIRKLNFGIKNIKQNDKKQLADALYKMIEGTNLTSFKMAEMIVDRAKGGLDFRFDAAKDISDMDALRNKKDTFEDNWEQVIGFWKKAAEEIYKENPNSYLVAEITDEIDLHKMGGGSNSKRFKYYKEEDDKKPYYYINELSRKFLRETGITATANYNHFFTDVAGIFGKLGENGTDRGTEQGYRVHNILKKGKGGEEFLYSAPYESILKSYTFIGNHDKPRILHILSMDMGLFFADLNDIKNFDYRKRAYTVLHPEVDTRTIDANMLNSFDFSYISAKAAARGESVNGAFYKALEKLNKQKDDKGKQYISNDQRNKVFDQARAVVAKLANGEYNGKIFEADNVGFEELHKIIGLVMKNIEATNVITTEQAKKLAAEVFEQALDPALSNALALDKFLVNLPGIPTTYAGDDLGSTGFETKTKNMYLKNRAAVHHDWANTHKFIQRHKLNADNVKLLRSRPVLHALNDGAPFLLPEQGGSGYQVAGLLRYAPDGNAVISMFNVAGTSHTYDKYSNASSKPVYMSNNKINLTKNGDFIGLSGGLTPGMEFINIYNENDKYYVYQDGGQDDYYLAHADKSQPIVLKDNTLTLYHASDELKQRDKVFLEKVKTARENHVSFCGNRKVLYNPKYNIAPADYSKVNNVEAGVGKKLAISCS